MTEGNEGKFAPLMIDQGALLELRDVAGPAPYQGQHWVMVDLYNGMLKWYQRRRKNYGGYGYGRSRNYRRRW